MNMKMQSVVIDCRDAQKLASFYSRFLGWEQQELCLQNPQGGTGLAFKEEEFYLPPLWPEEPGEQQKMLQLNFLVDDLEEATMHAIACGAIIAPTQYSDTMLVMMDPAGHPFCLYFERNDNENAICF